MSTSEGVSSISRIYHEYVGGGGGGGIMIHMGEQIDKSHDLY